MSSNSLAAPKPPFPSEVEGGGSRPSVSRRELLAAAGAAFFCACATVPRGGGAPGDDLGPSRTCDHDLCRYWRRNENVAPHPEDDLGEFEAGWCSIHLPEAFK